MCSRSTSAPTALRTDSPSTGHGAPLYSVAEKDCSQESQHGYKPTGARGKRKKSCFVADEEMQKHDAEAAGAGAISGRPGASQADPLKDAPERQTWRGANTSRAALQRFSVQQHPSGAQTDRQKQLARKPSKAGSGSFSSSDASRLSSQVARATHVLQGGGEERRAHDRLLSEAIGRGSVRVHWDTTSNDAPAVDAQRKLTSNRQLTSQSQASQLPPAQALPAPSPANTVLRVQQHPSGAQTDLSFAASGPLLGNYS